MRTYTVSGPADAVTAPGELAEVGAVSDAPDAPFLEAMRAARAGGGMTGVTVPEEPTRLVVAIADVGERWWFFKLTGPTGVVEAVEPAVREWLGTVRFTGGDPVWELPAGWDRLGPRSMRFATLAVPVPGEPGAAAEVAVSALPDQGSGVFDEEPLAGNLDRWRGQVGRAPGTGPAPEPFSLGDDTPALLFAVSSPTDADGDDPDATTSSSPPATPAVTGRPAVPFAYTVPAGWRAERPTGTSVLAFAVAGAAGEAEVTAARFAAGSMRPDQIAPIWRGTFRTAAALPADERDPLVVAGTEAPRLVLPPAEPGGARVLGTAAELGGALWVFKLAGPDETVTAAADTFETFLASLAFPDAADGGSGGTDEEDARAPGADVDTDTNAPAGEDA